MTKGFVIIDGMTKEFLLEVYYRIENDSPDYSVEYSEEVEMTASEIAEQLVTDRTEGTEKVIIVIIDKSTQDFLVKVHEHYEEYDGMLFASLDMTEAMESFLYSLGKYLIQGDYNEPFSLTDSCQR